MRPTGFEPTLSTLLAIRADGLFDGARDRGPSTILVEAGRIVSVHPGRAEVPSRAEVVDLGENVWLLPGLIDAHVHLAFDCGADLVERVTGDDDATLLSRMRQAAAEALHAGITTVRDLGDRAYLSVELREELIGHPEQGPEIVAAGPPITTHGGHCHFLGGAAEGREALLLAVLERAERGCQVVKVMASGGQITPGSESHQPQYDLGDLRAIVQRAHDLGMTTAAHAHATASVAAAVEAGFDTVEHATFLSADGVDTDQELIERIADRGTFVSVSAGFQPNSMDLGPELSRDLPKIIDNFQRLHKAGARLIVGTDAGVNASKPHNVLPHGMLMLAAAGMTNAQILKSATADAADACGLAGRKGRVVPGADADLVAVQGNPIADLAAVHDVRAVYRAGRRVR